MTEPPVTAPPADATPADPTPSAPSDGALPGEQDAPPGDLETPATDAPLAPPGALWESLWQPAAMRRAREQVASHELSSGADLRRAQSAHAVALRVLDPADPLPQGPTPHLALLLLRESAFWAFRAMHIAGSSLAEQLAAAPHDLLTFAAGGDEHLDATTARLLGNSHDEALRPLDEQERDAREVAAFTRALLVRATGPAYLIQQIWTTRLLKVGSLLLGTVGLLVTLALGIQRATTPPDLTAGKPWRTSSVYRNYTPGSHVVDGNMTGIFFHTSEEANPWVEFDLQKPTRVKSVFVKNRTDCCSERAVPLVVEVSNDRNQWTEVARRNEDFRTWNAEFAPREARYVRLRTLRKTWLHLEKVQIHDR